MIRGLVCVLLAMQVKNAKTKIPALDYNKELTDSSLEEIKSKYCNDTNSGDTILYVDFDDFSNNGDRLLPSMVLSSANIPLVNNCPKFCLAVARIDADVNETLSKLFQRFCLNSRTPFLAIVNEKRSLSVIEAASDHYITELLVAEQVGKEPQLRLSMNDFYSNFDANSPNKTLVPYEPRRRKLPGTWRNTVVSVAAQMAPPYSFLGDKAEMYGLDVEMMKLLSQKLKFRIKYIGPFTERGYVQPDGSFDQLYGLLQRKEANLGIGLFMMDNTKTSKFFEMSRAYLIDTLRVAVPKFNKVDPHFLLPNKVIWASLGISYVLTTAVWCLIIDRTNRAFLSTFRVLVGNSLPRTPSRFSARMLWASWALGSWFLILLMQSYSTYRFTHETFYPEIETFEDLLDSGLPIGWHGLPYSEMFNDLAELDRKLAKKFVAVCTVTIPCLELAAVHKNISVVRPMKTIEYYQPFHLDENGDPQIHAVKKSIFSRYATIYMTKGYPLLEDVDRSLRWMVDAGLMDYLDEWFEFLNLLAHSTNLVRDSKFKSNSLRLARLGLEFRYLMSGWALGVVVFICELIAQKVWSKCKRLA